MSLSPRELQNVALLQQGLTNKEIGLALALSHHTVRDIISPMFARFDLKNRVALLVAVSVKFPQLPTANSPATPRAPDRRGGGERRLAPRP